jgi:hypothetical protein
VFDLHVKLDCLDKSGFRCVAIITTAVFVVYTSIFDTEGRNAPLKCCDLFPE